MKYNCTEIELKMIEEARIQGSDDEWFISCRDGSDNYYLLTDGTMPKYDGSKHYKKVYHSSKEELTRFYKEWKESKEVKKKELAPKKAVKRMSAKEFKGALSEI